MKRKIISTIIVSLTISQLMSTLFLSTSIKASSSTEYPWPTFHADNTRAGYSSAWAPNTDNVAWSYLTSDSVLSSPAVTHGKVFFGSVDETFYALDQDTGTLVWPYDANEGIISSPAVADGMVFFCTVGNFSVPSRDVYALDQATGSKVWKKTIGTCTLATNEGSPAVAGGKVFLCGGDGTLYCLDEYSGNPIWSKPMSGNIIGAPAVSGGKVFAAEGYILYALDVNTGDKLWSYYPGDPLVGNTVHGGKVFTCSGQRVHARDADTGSYEWTYDAGSSITFKSSPAVADGKVFVLADTADDREVVYALSESSGSRRWSRNLGYYSSPWPIFGHSSPAVADGKVYVGSWDNKVYCLDEDDGSVIWSYTTGDKVVSSPAVSDGVVFVGSWDHEVYAFKDSSYSLTIEVVPSEGGTTDPPPGTHWYADGTYVTVTASPNSGYEFDRWELDGSNVGSDPSYTVYMDRPHILKAIFRTTVTPDFILSVSPTAKEITAGQSATYTVSVTSLNGFSSPVALSLWRMIILGQGSIKGTSSYSWDFEPNPVTPLADGSVESILTIETQLLEFDSDVEMTFRVKGDSGDLSRWSNIFELVVKAHPIVKYFPYWCFSNDEEYYPVSFYFDEDMDIKNNLQNYTAESWDGKMAKTCVYIHTETDENCYTIQYWLYYVYNEHYFRDHNHDWDSTAYVILDKSTLDPLKVRLYRHLGWMAETYDWDYTYLDKTNDHPHIYVAYGSHGAHTNPSDISDWVLTGDYGRWHGKNITLGYENVTTWVLVDDCAFGEGEHVTRRIGDEDVEFCSVLYQNLIGEHPIGTDLWPRYWEEVGDAPWHRPWWNETDPHESNWALFKTDCPVDLIVSDPLGRWVGTNETGHVVIDIPDAIYTGPDSDPEVMIIPNPIYGDYVAKIFGRETGTYNFTVIRLMNDTEKYFKEYKYVPIEDNETQVFAPEIFKPVFNLNTRLDYATIQEGINAAETLDGHVLKVRAGIYYEHVVVSKSVSLVGENKSITIIDGGGTGAVIEVTVSNVKITGFTIRNEGIDNYWPKGIYVSQTSGVNISCNTITNNWIGIYLYESSNNSISRNNIVENNITVPGSGSGVYLTDSSNNSILENNITNNRFGIIMEDGSSNNIIYRNNMTANHYDGVHLSQSSDSSILTNNITANNRFGVWLWRSSNNTVYENKITANQDEGIYMTWSYNNSIYGNNIEYSSSYGLMFQSSSGNFIYHNNFVNNTPNVWMYNSTNVWDAGYPSGGNYWSDYTDPDKFRGPNQNEPNSDGIVDAPYDIDANNTDRYPLMKPYGGPHDIGITHVTPSKTVIGQGYSLNIPTKILNYGINTETFNITAYATINQTQYSDTPDAWDHDEGVINPSNAVDGNWNTCATVMNDSAYHYVYENYNIPNYTQSARLTYKFYLDIIIHILDSPEIKVEYWNYTKKNWEILYWHGGSTGTITRTDTLPDDGLSGNVLMIRTGLKRNSKYEIAKYCEGRIEWSLLTETIIQTKTITLASRNSTTVTFTWNTTGVAVGHYTITAYAWPVSGETATADNTYVDGIVTILAPTAPTGGGSTRPPVFYIG